MSKKKLRIVRAKSKSQVSRVDARNACSKSKPRPKPEEGRTIREGIVGYVKPKKVYCDDCKYLRDNISRFAFRPVKYFCCTPYNLVKQKDFKSNWKQPVADPQELNFNNNCKYHKRKWYKFWK